MRVARRSLVAVGIAAAVAAAVSGCGGSTGSVVSPAPSPTASSPGAVAPSAGGSAASPATPSPPASPAQSSGGPPASGPTVHDPSLLALLPADVGGVPVTEEAEAFAAALADPAFAANVARAAFPVVVSGDDLASGVVAVLVPGKVSDAFLRDWRTTYDQGACEQAGGVSGTAEATLGGRTVHITSCAGGLRVYHAYLAERNAIVSVFSVGPGGFGERLMAGLHP